MGGSSLPKITLIATDSTLGCYVDDNLDTVTYGEAPSRRNLTGREILQQVPEVNKIADVVDVIEHRLRQYSTTYYLDLARIIDKIKTPVVVIRGTNDIPEVSFFLDLVLDGSKTVIVCGAMRPMSALSGDGKYNLLQACALAGNPAASGRGVMIVLNDRITSGFYGVKHSANRLDTFQGHEAGQLGVFSNWIPNFFYEPAKPMNKPNFIGVLRDENVKVLPKVKTIWSSVEMEESELLEFDVADYKGLVYAMWGGGGWNHASWDDNLRDLAKDGLPIVRTSHSATMYMAATEHVNSRGQIASGHFNANKSKILLQLAIAAHGQDVVKIREVFGTSVQLPNA